jgi:hypothetical protein
MPQHSWLPHYLSDKAGLPVDVQMLVQSFLPRSQAYTAYADWLQRPVARKAVGETLRQRSIMEFVAFCVQQR